MNNIIYFLILFILFISNKSEGQKPRQVSGIFPHLAMYNSQGECGTGAVVPWANRLWVITYSPHFPYGSDDKLYEITRDLKQIIREESIGGTPANRMIHTESKQLFIGSYAIDFKRNVKAIPYSLMQGRHTGNARHLFDPANKIYYATMEEGFYEVDVNTVKPTLLFIDGNKPKSKGNYLSNSKDSKSANLKGAHGKGLYSGQGVLVYSNNGETSKEAMKQFDVESGVLAEWDGENWKTVRRNQFVEVTGPGGIYGNENPETDPIWVTGWDHKSLLLGVRNAKTGWQFYRLPKASHSYDGAHGWNTEWPRIRNVGTPSNPDYLMTMHGLFWSFPETFTAQNSGGIRPRSAYLKVIGDFSRWNNQLVFGCDDSAQKEFLNKRKQKGGIEGPGQSNSNLWFTSLEKPSQLGPNTATGSVWLEERIEANEVSEPFLFSGWTRRIAWVKNHGKKSAEFTFEIDKNGDKNWEGFKKVKVTEGESVQIEFLPEITGEWIRVVSNAKTIATVNFSYSDGDDRKNAPSKIFEGLATINERESIGGLLYGLGKNRRALGVSLVNSRTKNINKSAYYELNSEFNLIRKKDEKTNSFIKEKFAIPQNVVEIQESSVLIIDDKNRRWRLPLGDKKYKELTEKSQLRICREVATERDLFNCSGTFYELPAENADGFAKIRPISSHNFKIHDYASYRGMLVMTGIEFEAKAGEHIVRSKDEKAAVWLGAIDDLWEMEKPRGYGGPWKNSNVIAKNPSVPYLIGSYDKKALEISHKLDHAVTFKIEVEPVGHGPWMLYKSVIVKPEEKFRHIFSDNFQARWIRFSTDKNCIATTLLDYK